MAELGLRLFLIIVAAFAESNVNHEIYLNSGQGIFVGEVTEGMNVASEIECARHCVAAGNCVSSVMCSNNLCFLLDSGNSDFSSNTTHGDCLLYEKLNEDDQQAPSSITSCQNGGTLTSGVCNCPPYVTGNVCELRIKDCRDVSQHQMLSIAVGTYAIWPVDDVAPFDVECTGREDNGILMMERDIIEPSCSPPNTFVNSNWASFRDGFAHSSCFKWLGLEKIHALTNGNPYKLVMEFVNPNSENVNATYDYFSVANESNEFRLSVGNFTAEGDVGDFFKLDEPSGTMYGVNFCTIDHCETSGQVCGNNGQGGWWYRQDTCQHNPHGEHNIKWGSSTGGQVDMKQLTMWLVPN